MNTFAPAAAAPPASAEAPGAAEEEAELFEPFEHAAGATAAIAATMSVFEKRIAQISTQAARRTSGGGARSPRGANEERHV
jgi:hypothetical protein